MWPKPVIFISAVSKELGSARQLVANTLTKLGYDQDHVPTFPTEHGEIKAMLRRRIDAANGVIQLVGQCQGFEPPLPDPDFGRVSYTQYEALYARQSDKKVWYVVLDDSFPTDPHDPEPEGVRQLQAAYRQRVLNDKYLYHPPATLAELKGLVHELKDELGQLRRRSKHVAVLVVSLLLLIVMGGVWFKHDQSRQSSALGQIAQQNEKLLRAVRELPATLNTTNQVMDKKSDSALLSRAYSTLEDKLKLPRGTLEKELPRFAEQLLRRADTSLMERASALFITRRFAEAEEAALKVKDQALVAAGDSIRKAIDALMLAASAAEEVLNYGRALEHYRAAATLANRERDPLRWGFIQDQIADALSMIGDYRQAAVVRVKAIQAYQQVWGSNCPAVLHNRESIATGLIDQGNYADAEREFRAVLRIHLRLYGADDPETLYTRDGLACVLRARGKYAEAEKEHRVVLGILERCLGSEHYMTINARSGLGEDLLLLRRGKEAEAAFREVLASQQRLLAPNHPYTLMTWSDLACALMLQGKYAQAEVENRKLLEIRRRVQGPEHPGTLVTRNNLAQALCGQGKYSEAEAEHRARIAIEERVLGISHPSLYHSLYNLAVCLKAQDKKVEALAFARQALAGWQKTLNETHPDTQRAKRLVEELEKTQ